MYNLFIEIKNSFIDSKDELSNYFETIIVKNDQLCFVLKEQITDISVITKIYYIIDSFNCKAEIVHLGTSVFILIEKKDI